MTCSKYERLLSAYLDRELSAEEATMLKRHMIGCASCASLLDEFERIKQALEELEPAEAPDGLFDMGIIRAKALEIEIAEESSGIGVKRFGFFSFIGKALLPAALVGTLVALPMLQLVFKVDIAGSIVGLVKRDAVTDIAEAPVVVLPDLNPGGYGTLETASIGGASFGSLTLGTVASVSDLTLSFEDTKLSRYVQTFDNSRSTTADASYSRNW
jgi:hypothetical protein